MMRAALIPLYLMIIVIAPGTIALSPLLIAGTGVMRIAAGMFAPVLWAAAYVLVAGLLSLPHQHAIRPGKFPRRLDHPGYRHRRLYGLCWTAVYYCTPVYFVFLSIPLLKTVLFRLFGYRGDMGFTLYPDTWIRDLPLLDFGRGAYISNRATIATNVVFRNGVLLVDRVSIGSGALIGHLALLAPGVSVGAGAEVGVSSALSLGVVLEPGARVGARCSIDNGVTVGESAQIGNSVYLGPKTVVQPSAVVRSGSAIPGRSIVMAGDPCGAGGCAADSSL